MLKYSVYFEKEHVCEYIEEKLKLTSEKNNNNI